MIESEEQLLAMVNSAEERERKARRNALLYTLLPILFALVLLTVTGGQVQKASREVEASQAKLADTQKELETAEADLQAADQQNTAIQGQLIENSRILSETVAKATQAAGQLATMSVQLEKTQKQLEVKQTEISNLQFEYNLLEEQANELTEQLKLASRFQDYYYEGDLMLVYKNIWNLQAAGQLRPGVAELLDRIFGNLQVPWKINGTSFEEGVNSPTYAALVLAAEQLLPNPDRLPLGQAGLMELLPLVQGEPQIGDVIYYREGYTFFYMKDEENQPFVLGMSPFGVVALRYDFSVPLGIGVIIN